MSGVVRNDANKILDCIEAGGDPKDLILVGVAKGSQAGNGRILPSILLHITFSFCLPIPKRILILKQRCLAFLAQIARQMALSSSSMTASNLSDDFSLPWLMPAKTPRTSILEPPRVVKEACSCFSFIHFTQHIFFFAGHALNLLLIYFADMARFIGSDCTKGALEWQFRRYRAGAKLQIAAVDAGQDPKDINVDVNPQGKPDGKGSTDRDNGPKFLHYYFFQSRFPLYTTC